MKSKRIKSLPILLALLMILCIMPATVAGAAGPKFQIHKLNIGSAQNNYVYGQPATRAYMKEGTKSYYVTVQPKNMTAGTRYNVRYEICKGKDVVAFDYVINRAANTGYSFTVTTPLSPGKYTVKVIISGANYTTTTYEVMLGVYSSGAYSFIEGTSKGAGAALSAYTMAEKAYQLSAGAINARQAAEYIITRSSMIGLSNVQYVDKLYNVLLCRNYDVAGRNYWIGELESGRRTRNQVLWGFLNSQEFKNITNTRGLNY